MSEIGYVYILSNEAMPGIYKIGTTSREDLDARLRELYTTSVPLPFECAFSCKIEDYKKVEKILHNAFSDYRINPNREFFKVAPERAIPILEHLNVEEATTIVNERLNQAVDETDRKAIEKYVRRPNFNFHEMGIENGETITFYDESRPLEVEVVSDRTVRYMSENRSLSKLTAELLGYEQRYVAPMRYWKHKGKSLRKYYDETYGEAE